MGALAGFLTVTAPMCVALDDLWWLLAVGPASSNSVPHPVPFVPLGSSQGFNAGCQEGDEEGDAEGGFG